MAYLLEIDPNYMMLPLDATPFAINANTRAINAPKIVTLQNDQIADMLIFTIDRYYDFMDLYNATVYVQWTLPDGKTQGATEIEFKDVETIPGKIRFGWALDSEVTSQVGQVKYSVRFWQKSAMTENNETVDKVVYSLNTLTSSFTVSPSLQVEINEDSEVNRPIGTNLFKRTVKNSMLTGEGMPLPLEPSFGEPGLDLPISASLKENTLTLKAQAVVGDTGSISYKWYYRPVVTETLNIGGTEVEFVAGVEYEYEDIINADGQEVKGFKAFGGTIEDKKFELVPKTEYENGIAANEQYYTKLEDGTYVAYTDTKPPVDENIELYQRFTTYTVPTGDTKVTGEYCVRAVNTVGSGKKTNSSNPHASRVCRLISPDPVTITNVMPATAIIPDNGSAQLTIKTVAQTSKDTEVSYTWMKAIKDNTFAENDNTEVLTSGNNVFDIREPGWYKATVAAKLNRETRTAETGICKVTFKPDLPIVNYTTAMQSEIKENDTIPTVEGDGAIELQVVRGSIIPSEYIDNDNEGEDNTYAIELFSDRMDFVWSVKEPDKEPRILTDSDIGVLVVDGLNTDTLTVNADKYIERIYTCNIINTLNGEKIESKDQAAETKKGSLSFRII